MNMLKSTLILVFLSGTVADGADYFRFTDETGTIHFVDDFGKIPDRFRRQRGFHRRPLYDLPQNTTPVAIRNNQILVPVTVEAGGRKERITLLLDTGASQTALLETAAARLGLGESEGEEMVWEVAGGGTIVGRALTIPALTVGPHKRADMKVGIIEHQGEQPDYDGLLGMDFLGSVRYRIDAEAPAIRWNP